MLSSWLPRLPFAIMLDHDLSCKQTKKYEVKLLDYDVFPEQRQALIHQTLEEKGRVVCVDLAKQLGVSEHTIRRDLQELARRGLCKKVYGGAVSPPQEATNFLARSGHKLTEKNALARKCVQLIKEKSCVFLDTGTTHLAIAQALPDDITLTIVTNSPLIAAELIRVRQCEVILLGGKLNKEVGGILGSEPINQLRDIEFDLAFVGACAFDPQTGLTGFDYDDACFKKEIVKKGCQTVLALTAEKITSVARYKIAAPEDIDYIVVSSDADITPLAPLSLQIEIAK